MNFEMIKRLMECPSEIYHVFRLDVSDLFSYSPISPGKQNFVCVMCVWNSSEKEKFKVRQIIR